MRALPLTDMLTGPLANHRETGMVTDMLAVTAS